MPTQSRKDSTDQQIQENILKESAQPRQSTSVKESLDKKKKAPVSVALRALGHQKIRPR
jgi:hypothetical protein